MSRFLNLFFIVSFIACINVQSQTVYITKSGEKYHKASCRYLKYSKKEIKLKDAITKGYEACKVCKPSSKKIKTITPKSNSLTNSSNQPATPSKKLTASQCKGKTKAGKRCKRTTKNSNGKCYQHQ